MYAKGLAQESSGHPRVQRHRGKEREGGGVEGGKRREAGHMVMKRAKGAGGAQTGAKRMGSNGGKKTKKGGNIKEKTEA